MLKQFALKWCLLCSKERKKQKRKNYKFLKHKKVETFGCSEATRWNKPIEWDSKLPKSFFLCGDKILKPLENPEWYFYSIKPEITFKAKAPKDVDPESCGSLIKEYKNFANCPDSLRSLIPRFYGVKVDRKGNQYICLENLMKGMRNPTICDIKVGTRSFDPFANRIKIDEVKDKFPPRKLFGFRIVGMQTYDGKGKLLKNKRNWGRDLVDWKKDVEGKFIRPYVSQMTEVQKKKVLRELKRVDNLWTQIGSKNLLLFSSSLYIVYDAAIAVGNDEGEDDDYDPQRIIVKLIDFNHSFYRKDHPKVEDGVLQGIRNIRRGFLNVLNGSSGDLGDSPVMI